MQVIDRKKEGTAESFFVISKHGYLEMHPSSTEEREKWISCLKTVISDHIAQELSRRPGKHHANKGITRHKSIPGCQAPIWIKDHFANLCMQCDESFNAIRRRHHCRACGIVVCGRCSSKQMPLEFDGFSQIHRVCDKCFNEIESCVEQNLPEQTTNASTNLSPLMRIQKKDPSDPGQRQTSIFFFPASGEKPQNRGQTNDELKFSALTSSLEAIIDTSVET